MLLVNVITSWQPSRGYEISDPHNPDGPAAMAEAQNAVAEEALEGFKVGLRLLQDVLAIQLHFPPLLQQPTPHREPSKPHVIVDTCQQAS